MGQNKKKRIKLSFICVQSCKDDIGQGQLRNYRGKSAMGQDPRSGKMTNSSSDVHNQPVNLLFADVYVECGHSVVYLFFALVHNQPVNLWFVTFWMPRQEL